MTSDPIYLDYNATAPLRLVAQHAMMDAMGPPGNPSSVHHQGQKARAIVELAREQVALGIRSIANVNSQMRVSISWEAFRWHMPEKIQEAPSFSSRSDQLST